MMPSTHSNNLRACARQWGQVCMNRLSGPLLGGLVAWHAGACTTNEPSNSQATNGTGLEGSGTPVLTAVDNHTAMPSGVTTSNSTATPSSPTPVSPESSVTATTTPFPPGTGKDNSSAGGTAGTQAEQPPAASDMGGAGGANAAAGGNQGGAGANGAAGSSSPTPIVHTPPLFVTSGPDDYWNTSMQTSELDGATAELTVDSNTKYQRWDGFGGTFNEMGWDALSVISTEIPRALKLLFDGQDGAGFVYGRIPIGASDYSMSWYTLAETPNDYAMDDFSIARDQEMLIPYIRAALEVNPELRLWGSPWVVPNWMMDGRSMRNDAQTLEAHALYFAKFVEEYGKVGLTIEAVHPQNEPGYARVSWSHAQFIDFIKTYLGPKFSELGLSAEIWCGTMSHPDDADIATTLTDDPDAMSFTTGFGLQWNLQDTVAELAPFGPVMQTEHKCGNYNFSTPYWDQSRYDPNEPQNDHLYGEESWQLIRDWVVAGVNSYSAWNMVLDTKGRSLDGWPQNALLVVDRESRQLITTPAYYVFRHYSQYIAPGATRIDVQGSNDAVAFENPDGSIVLELYNSDDAAWQTTASVGGRVHQFDVPAHGWATLRVTP